MRVAAFKRNGKLFGTFTSLDEASRVLNIAKRDIAGSITGKHKCAWALSGPQRHLGSFYFREIDSRDIGVS